ncbi:hypothetical protein [Nostoc edaphicum]|uniref:hypothetical protein n=1 Tax=Nostoc edaphicum TaxID=264686 RepID=UPI001EEBC0BD|nr:hypothetical protein [Nostoc edaphicum]
MQYLLADLGWSQAFEAALLKLLAAMPAANCQHAEMVSQRIHVDPTGWHRWDEKMSAFVTLKTKKNCRFGEAKRNPTKPWKYWVSFLNPTYTT